MRVGRAAAAAACHKPHTTSLALCTLPHAAGEQQQQQQHPFLLKFCFEACGRSGSRRRAGLRGEYARGCVLCALRA